DSGKLLTTFRGHAPKAVTAIAFSPNRKWIASGADDQTIRVWEADTGKEIVAAGPIQRTVDTLAFHSHGKSMAYGGTAQRIFIYEVPSGTLKFELPGLGIGNRPPVAHSVRVRTLAYSSDGHWIASGGDDHIVRLWKADAPAPQVFAAQAH